MDKLQQKNHTASSERTTNFEKSSKNFPICTNFVRKPINFEILLLHLSYDGMVKKTISRYCPFNYTITWTKYYSLVHWINHYSKDSQKAGQSNKHFFGYRPEKLSWIWISFSNDWLPSKSLCCLLYLDFFSYQI